MDADETVSFDTWVRFCFTGSFYDVRPNGFGAVRNYQCLPPISFDCLADYIVRLFLDPTRYRDEYDARQIERCVNFLFGVDSDYFCELRFADVEPSKVVACIDSVATFYTDLLDRVCCDYCSHPDGKFIGRSGLDSAVYMIWDMGPLIGGVHFSDRWPHLKEPGLRLLETILLECQTSSCKMSALHGLGHLHSAHPAECERIIDRFLECRPDQPPWLVSYAGDARTGMIM